MTPRSAIQAIASDKTVSTTARSACIDAIVYAATRGAWPRVVRSLGHQPGGCSLLYEQSPGGAKVEVWFSLAGDVKMVYPVGMEGDWQGIMEQVASLCGVRHTRLEAILEDIGLL